MTATNPRRVSGLATAGLITLVTGLLFVLLEGAASLLLSADQLTTRRDTMAEVAHTEYDPLVGWINLPDFRVENMYGPGVYLQTNGQRFRNDRDFPKHVPEGKTRIICSGDSYTLGHSVDNDHTWCELLAHKNSTWESVNMGQGGYGIDQAYLWYMRDGIAFDHDVQVFAFITPDFDRMKHDTFLGYGRPVVRAIDGELVVDNVPVPLRHGGVSAFDAVQRTVGSLRIVELGQAVMGRLGWKRTGTPPLLSDDDVRNAVKTMFATLREANEAKSSAFVVVYLPRSIDRDDRSSDPWRGFLYQEARESGLIFIDLVESFRSLPLDVGQQLFHNPYHASHYSVAGNEWVAELLADKLLADPTTAAALGR